MTSAQRVQSVLDGRRPDRPPVSFWCHFGAGGAYGPAAVEAHVRQIQTYDLDFLKIMNDNGYPHEPIHRIEELATLGPLSGDEPQFIRQLELIRQLRRRLGPDVKMISTIFNALATLRGLVKPPAGHGPPQMDAAVDGPAAFLRQMAGQDAGAFKAAMDAIGRNLAVLARRSVEAGADGIYLSVRDDWLELTPKDRGRYDALVRASDLAIVAGAAAGTFNLLHACGKPVNLRAFGAYPVQAINWADRAAGPAIAEAKAWLKPAICAGVNNMTTLPQGTPQDCANEVADALRQAGDRPIMITPGCTYDPGKVPAANLQAMVRAARAN